MRCIHYSVYSAYLAYLVYIYDSLTVSCMQFCFAFVTDSRLLCCFQNLKGIWLIYPKDFHSFNIHLKQIYCIQIINFLIYSK